MEKFQEAREKALRNLQIADHMVSTTYPLLKDNRLLLTATENLINFEGIEIIACNDGKVAARWGSWNGVDILEQMRGYSNSSSGTRTT